MAHVQRPQCGGPRGHQGQRLLVAESPAPSDVEGLEGREVTAKEVHAGPQAGEGDVQGRQQKQSAAPCPVPLPLPVATPAPVHAIVVGEEKVVESLGLKSVAVPERE